MKIFIYCQHVLGMGHFFRTLEIIKALHTHEVLLITGGKPVETPLPSHVIHVTLPPLMMDPEFKAIHTDDTPLPLETIQQNRYDILRDTYETFAPDIFIIELYPFGRKAFGFELKPLLKNIRQKKVHPSKVICSLRDILVEKKDRNGYEKQVLHRLNTYFDELIVHSDPKIIPLDLTFSRVSDIKVPLYYSGFVAPSAPLKSREDLRKELKIAPNERLIVVSCGGGSVGADFVETVAKSLPALSSSFHIQGIIIGGPFMDEKSFQKLSSYESPSVHVCRFRKDFRNLLAAADLSISMAGYNTMMDIAATKVPALVFPFAQNREQRLRVNSFSQFNMVDVLNKEGLSVDYLQKAIHQKLSEKHRAALNKMDINGASFVASHIEKQRE